MSDKKHSIELAGLLGVMNPLNAHNAGARNGMASGHFSQAVPISKHNIPAGYSGYERQLPTYDVRMPVDAIISSIHRRINNIYKRDPNNYITIIYQAIDTGEYSYLDVYRYNSQHIIYGSEFVLTKEFLNTQVGDQVKKGTVLAHPPSVIDGMYSVGRDINVLNLSLLSTNEDAFMVSDKFCQDCGLTEIVIVTAQWGKNKFPRNTYGNADGSIYKCYPEVGEFVRPDGVIIALSDYDDKNIVNLRDEELTKVNYLTDKLSCVTDPGFQVFRIDVTMEKLKQTDRIEYSKNPMYKQTLEHADAQSGYFKEIVGAYNKIARNKNALISPKLINLVYAALCNEPNDYNDGNTGIIRKEIKRVPIDDIHITIHLKRVVPLEKGDKFTNRHGHKGVISLIVPYDQMPTDISGNVADVVKLGAAIVNRTNTAQLIEQYLGASARDLAADLRIHKMNGMSDLDIMGILLEFYEIVSPNMYNVILTKYSNDDKIKHVKSVLEGRLHFQIPPNPNYMGMDLVKRVKNKFPAVNGPITYTGYTGLPSTTIRNGVIGVEHIMVLEQSHQQPMATSSSKLQHLGLITSTAKHSRKAANAKDHSTTVFSETEGRLTACAMGGEVIAEILDHYNNPDAHVEIIRNILENEYPTNIPEMVDVPYGNSRAILIVENMLECIGLKMLKTGD